MGIRITITIYEEKKYQKFRRGVKKTQLHKGDKPQIHSSRPIKEREENGKSKVHQL